MLEALYQGLVNILTPLSAVLLIGGVLFGTALGTLPGLSGLPGYAILIPFIYGLPPEAALPLFVGMSAGVNTCDSIPAILFGVPGSAGAQAHILDGYPMARKGEAGRALGANFASTAVAAPIGAAALIGAAFILRPVVLAFASPEFFMLMLLGIIAIAILSKGARLKGLIAGTMGLLLAMIGLEAQESVRRFTFGSLYLWDGIGIATLALGLFAIPELMGLVVQKTRIAFDSISPGEIGRDRWKGVRDVFRNWSLVLRSSLLGVFVGIIPGLGAAVVDWFSYIFARMTCKGAKDTFGTGDVRGVIAPECGSNAKTGGAWIPTIAFGIPGSAGMAMMLGVMIWILGLSPGPEMLTTHLDLTFTIAWGIILGNILVALLAFSFIRQVALITIVPPFVLIAVIMPILFIGSYVSHAPQLESLIVLLSVGFLGWFMKVLRWPRPPLLLGFVLGAMIETKFFISVQAYGVDMLLRPYTLLILFLVLAFISYSAIDVARSGGLRLSRKPRFNLGNCFTLLPLAAAAFALIESRGWPLGARLFPWVIGWAMLFLSLSQLALGFFQKESTSEILDTSLAGGIGGKEIARRSSLISGWLLGLFGAIYFLGFQLALPLFTFSYLKWQAKMKWPLTIGLTALTAILTVVLFGQILQIVWPEPLIHRVLPAAFWPF